MSVVIVEGYTEESVQRVVDQLVELVRKEREVVYWKDGTTDFDGADKG
ncbi:hypothetical protein LCGC14_3100630, partial [marine sediment metagenome]